MTFFSEDLFKIKTTKKEAESYHGIIQKIYYTSTAFKKGDVVTVNKDEAFNTLKEAIEDFIDKMNITRNILIKEIFRR